MDMEMEMAFVNASKDALLLPSFTGFVRLVLLRIETTVLSKAGFLVVKNN